MVRFSIIFSVLYYWSWPFLICIHMIFWLCTSSDTWTSASATPRSLSPTAMHQHCNPCNHSQSLHTVSPSSDRTFRKSILAGWIGQAMPLNARQGSHMPQAMPLCLWDIARTIPLITCQNEFSKRSIGTCPRCIACKVSALLLPCQQAYRQQCATQILRFCRLRHSAIYTRLVCKLSRGRDSAIDLFGNSFWQVLLGELSRQ